MRDEQQSTEANDWEQVREEMWNDVVASLKTAGYETTVGLFGEVAAREVLEGIASYWLAVEEANE